jgi:hypothetical protein
MVVSVAFLSRVRPANEHVAQAELNASQTLE